MSSKLITTPAVVLLGLSTGLAACADHSTPPGDNPETWGVPITGGNLYVARDQAHIVVADPDRDQLYVVDVHAGTAQAVPLALNDEPGRIIEDGAGRIHVALRRGNAVVTLASAASTEIVSRRPVCGDPRGLAWDPATDLIHVACSTGELVSMSATGGGITRTLRLDRDLRDVIVSGSNLLVTRFRTAEVLTLDAAGAVITRATPPAVARGGIGEPPLDDGTGTGSGSGAPQTPVGSASVAWRTIALTNGALLMTHQRQAQQTLSESEGGYGGMCGGGPIEDAVSLRNPDGTYRALSRLVHGSLPVDIAVSASGANVAIVSAGSRQISVIPTQTLSESSDDGGCDCPECGGGGGGGGLPADGGTASSPLPITRTKIVASQTFIDGVGIPTSVGFINDDVAVFYPEVPAVVLHSATASKTIRLPGEFAFDTGRDLFHSQTAVGIACASCHPEGHNDGNTWVFEMGPRRTQDLGGGVMQRAPFHWTGDMTDLTTLMEQVFAQRMLGGEPSEAQKKALGPFLDRIPAPLAPVAADPASVARGEVLFESQATGCATCHNGALLTNKQIVNVGTGASFKVPSLIGVGGRAPFIHDGCAKTLADRFGATCGGGDAHGHTSQLSTADVADLVAFLDTL